MPETDATVSEKVYDSPPSEPDDDFWLEQGGRMLAESLTTVRTAASALLSALGVLQGIYLGILGFAKFLHETLPWWPTYFNCYGRNDDHGPLVKIPRMLVEYVSL